MSLKPGTPAFSFPLSHLSPGPDSRVSSEDQIDPLDLLANGWKRSSYPAIAVIKMLAIYTHAESEV